MKLARALSLLAIPALVLATGCDPKKLDGANDNNNNDNGGGGGTPAAVTAEALVVGNILALHADLLAAGLSLAADFDTAAVAAPTLRGTLAAGCMALTEMDAGLPRWSISLEGCTDGHGTTYRGTGEVSPAEGVDGYAFLPWFDTDLIRASNETNDDYNHDIHSGSLTLAFTRAAGDANGVDVGNFLRHQVRTEIVTFTYDVHYSGAPGAYGDYPDSGSTARVVWDSVGIFDVEFNASGSATYTMQGATYVVNLGTGDVSVATS